jgi:PPK2 family polyphosphate:nucleotide phosphotransferase
MPGNFILVYIYLKNTHPMKMKEIVEIAHGLSDPYCITKGKEFKLKHVDPADTGDFPKKDKEKAKKALARGIKALTALQDVLYAQDQYSVLLIFQAMDAAGKDGAIKHVMSGINPQGCEVASFKTPTSTDLDHDYLWRCNLHLPQRGRIGIFNRSYYEEVLVVKVHPEFLQGQKIPGSLVNDDIWENRYREIRDYEKYLTNNGTVILKFFLHLSKDEQKARFLERIDNPEKNWKFSANDSKERAYWNEYMDAYEQMICNTAAKHAPWYVIPADNKWYTRLVVAAALIDAIGSLDLSYPKVDKKKLAELEEARKTLLEES